jgi:acyl-CoA hydrolase
MPGTLLKESAGRIDAEFMPLTSVQAVRYFESAQDIDVALVQVSPANADGMHSFGINTSNTRAMVKAAKCVIAEVNEEMPFTLGDSLIHTSARGYARTRRRLRDRGDAEGRRSRHHP